MRALPTNLAVCSHAANGLGRVLICISLLATNNWAASLPVSLKCSDLRLVTAFEWARRQALAYAFHGDSVGDWYEAALPGRQGFCMRDTAHQCMGAHFLGLDDATHNMLRKFSENISARRAAMIDPIEALKGDLKVTCSCAR
jgi:hypothetical protein